MKCNSSYYSEITRSTKLIPIKSFSQTFAMYFLYGLYICCIKAHLNTVPLKDNNVKHSGFRKSCQLRLPAQP